MYLPATLHPSPSPREGSLVSSLQIPLDNAWCLNLCKMKCISSYIYYSSELVTIHIYVGYMMSFLSIYVCLHK